MVKIDAGGGVVLRMRVDDGRDGAARLRLRLGVPPGASARFTDARIFLTVADSKEEEAVRATALDIEQGPVTPLAADATVDFSRIGPTTPEEIPADTPRKSIQVWLPFSIEGYHPRAVSIHLPPILTGSERYDVPAIELVEDAAAKERNRAEVKGKQQLWWWPYRSKSGREDDWARADGFTVTGGVTSGYLDGSFGGNLMVSFPAAREWRLSSDTIRVVDADTGAERRVRIARLVPVFDLTTAFTAPILGQGARFMTTARAELAVGTGPLESVTVRLPPLVVNGDAVRLEAVTFTRRVGVGIIPLNC